MIRRALAWMLLIALWSPDIAFAQAPGIGGVVGTAAASVSIVNTAVSTNLFSFTVPPRYYENFETPVIGAAALHVRSLGSISTNPSTGGVGTINMGCNYGGATASITMLNAGSVPQALASSPFVFDLWVRANASNQEVVEGLLFIPGAAAGATTTAPTTAIAINPSGTTNTGAYQSISCAWQWASASTSNSLSINHTIMVVGD